MESVTAENVNCEQLDREIDRLRSRIRRILQVASDPGVCRACGIQVRWLRHMSGSCVPYDFDGVMHRVTCLKRDQQERPAPPLSQAALIDANVPGIPLQADRAVPTSDRVQARISQLRERERERNERQRRNLAAIDRFIADPEGRL